MHQTRTRFSFECRRGATGAHRPEGPRAGRGKAPGSRSACASVLPGACSKVSVATSRPGGCLAAALPARPVLRPRETGSPDGSPNSPLPRRIAVTPLSDLPCGWPSGRGPDALAAPPSQVVRLRAPGPLDRTPSRALAPPDRALQVEPPLRVTLPWSGSSVRTSLAGLPLLGTSLGLPAFLSVRFRAAARLSVLGEQHSASGTLQRQPKLGIFGGYRQVNAVIDR